MTTNLAYYGVPSQKYSTVSVPTYTASHHVTYWNTAWYGLSQKENKALIFARAFLKANISDHCSVTIQNIDDEHCSIAIEDVLLNYYASSPQQATYSTATLTTTNTNWTSPQTYSISANANINSGYCNATISTTSGSSSSSDTITWGSTTDNYRVQPPVDPGESRPLQQGTIYKCTAPTMIFDLDDESIEVLAILLRESEKK